MIQSDKHGHCSEHGAARGGRKSAARGRHFQRRSNPWRGRRGPCASPRCTLPDCQSPRGRRLRHSGAEAEGEQHGSEATLPPQLVVRASCGMPSRKTLTPCSRSCSSRLTVAIWSWPELHTCSLWSVAHPCQWKEGGKGLPCRGEKRAFQPAASVAEKEVELLSGLHLEAGRLAVGHQPYRR